MLVRSVCVPCVSSTNYPWNQKTPQERADTVDVQIMNAYYEAENDINDNPERALENMQKVIELSGKQKDEVKHNVTRASVCFCVQDQQRF